MSVPCVLAGEPRVASRPRACSLVELCLDPCLLVSWALKSLFLCSPDKPCPGAWAASAVLWVQATEGLLPEPCPWVQPQDPSVGFLWEPPFPFLQQAQAASLGARLRGANACQGLLPHICRRGPAPPNRLLSAFRRLGEIPPLGQGLPCWGWAALWSPAPGWVGPPLPFPPLPSPRLPSLPLQFCLVAAQLARQTGAAQWGSRSWDEPRPLHPQAPQRGVLAGTLPTQPKEQ